MESPNFFGGGTGSQAGLSQSLGLLPRPCSMPSFDKNPEHVEKKNMRTLPFKSSSKRSLSFKPWKSMSFSSGSFLTSPTFGTPSYPAPLDTIRAKSACLSTVDIASRPEELNNNSLYSVNNQSNDLKHQPQKEDMFPSDKNLAESLHSFSYTPGFSRGTFAKSPAPALNSSLNASWQFFNFIGGADPGSALPTTTRNPNKALLTIDAKTSQILVANEIACKLFGYPSEELTRMKMSKLFAMKDGFRHEALLEQHIDTEGNVIMVSGKVIEAVDSSGNVIAVSLWMKRFKSDDDPRCIAVIEPVQRSVGSILFNAEGTIVDCDCQFAYLHGYTSPEEVVGLLIQNLIPAIMLPIPGQEIKKHVKKQRATGKARNSSRFPVSIKISEYDKDFHEIYLRRGQPDDIQFSKFLYKGIIWVFSNISGLISVLPDGVIHSCNSNFSLMLFGCSEEELVGKDITTLIPSFYDQMDLAEDRSLKIPSLSEDEEVQLDPNRDTALSGRFGFDSSSQSDLDSDFEGNIDKPGPFNDVSARGYAHDSSSDQTATSSLTIGSSNHNLSEASNGGISLANVASPMQVEAPPRSSSPEKAFNSPISGVYQDLQNFTESGSANSVLSPVKYLEVKEKSNESKNEHERKESDSSCVSGITLKSDSSGCADSTERSSTASSCNKSCCRPEKELTKNNSLALAIGDSRLKIGCDEGDCEKSPITNAENMEYIDVIYDRKKLNMSSDVDSEDLWKCEEERTKSQTKKNSFSFDMQKDVETKRDNGEMFCDEDSDVAAKGGPRRQEKADASIACEAAEDSNIEPYQGEVTAASDDDVYSAINYHRYLHQDCMNEVSPASNQSDKRGNEFVANDGSVVVDYTNEATLDPLSPTKRWQTSENKMKMEKDHAIFQQDQITSTPKLDRSDSQCKRIYEGNFFGQAKHNDESLLPIVFQVKQIMLNRGKEMFCIWISRDPEDQEESCRLASQLMLAGSFNSTLNTSHGNFADAMKSFTDLSMSLNEDKLTIKGEYDEKYKTLKSIGKGAFGFVKLAKRRTDSLEVVVKFVQKNKIVPASWIDDPVLGRVPLEIGLLAKLEHSNIVKMYEMFENDDFFQLVMEKHGEGIDLFEFIDRQPALDEALCSYMFQQIVSAVSYLHSKNILHRDVKDENIIIDKSFTLKLIDFGSAVFMEKGKLFSTFCGTVEYCSPEVLLGNKYHGPELEVWSLGITLYTVVFGENPFFDVEETIKAELRPPYKVSAELMFLICWMLHPEPSLRATVKDIEGYRWLNQKVNINLYDYDTIFAEDGDGYNTDQDDHSVSALDYEHNYDDDDDEYDDYVKDNERLEEEYLRYLHRQRSLPEYPEREHGASF